ncbi:GTP-binding protein [Lyngbya sp. CCY1209]|uniref:YcjF family protein n=1 Tax=Lyngbya sp. CCY1209 TaxID=2886103 RepID=UPI002D1FD530|nr:GTP-binding protein [Lyngbya sp. CCY1209]MEB3886882.1 GTP-binding protein [Lyngbya sp. CCY1209]
MPLSRLLIIIFGICLILVLTIWLVTSISWLYTQVAWAAHPILANLLVVILIGLLGLAIYAFIYYFRLLQPRGPSRKKRRPQLRIPLDKSEAAEASLQGLRQQVSQIQDDVARQVLLSRSQEIEANLSKGNIQVVVFGTGSAGKTSLINALLGRMVGEVNAPMGTTTAGATYQLKLIALERDILITDTPGILEAGEAGSERAEMARSLATEADLLLFVVDNDLQQSEFIPLRTLAEIGKRSLLIFNKTDLYTEEDKNTILLRLRERVGEFISSKDVIAIAANPQSIQLENGDTFKPDPDIMPLINQMATILRAEGEELVADNILLQSQRLGEEARNLIDTQRRRQAEKVVDRYQWIGAGAIAVTPLPVVDLLATAAVNAQMVVEIGKIYGCELNIDRGRDLALSLGKTLASLGIVKGAIQLVATALHFHIGTLVIGKAIQGVTAAYLTRIAGRSFIEYFRQDQDWGDGGMTEVVQRQFQLNRRDEFVRGFIKDAIARVVEPLNLNRPPEEEEETLEIELHQPEVESPYFEGDDWGDRRHQREDW